MESGNGGINGKSAINTIGIGEIIGGKYISFPKSSLKGNYYILFNKYIFSKNIYVSHDLCDHVTNLVISDWFNHGSNRLAYCCCVVDPKRGSQSQQRHH